VNAATSSLGVTELVRPPSKRPQEDVAETWLLAEFGKRLREARLSVGMSQAALAAASGVNRTYISEIESGK
jgi:ribosome-binding protein aMBF1 (putative translation factor)